MTDDRPDGSEADLVILEPETKDIAEIAAHDLVDVPAANASRGEDGVNESADPGHPDTARVTDENVLVPVNAHDDDLVVADLRDVVVFLTDAGAERRDENADFRELEHLVE